MGLIELVLFIAIVGLIVYLIATYVPMPAPFKTVIYAVAAIFVILILLRAVGFVDPQIPRLR